MPDLAKKAGAYIIGTGRSDFPNQINNVLASPPGIFRVALDARAKCINNEMKNAASMAIASLISPEELSPEYIFSKAFDPRVGKTAVKAVYEAAIESKCTR